MRSHDQKVHDQFDSQAQAYLQSGVHARGPDLSHAESLLRQALSGGGKALPVLGALDVGCGAGHLSFALASTLGRGAARVVALDPSAAMLATVTQAAAMRGLSRIETCQAGAESLPFDDSSFGWAVTRYSAHHWRHLEAGLREMSRVLVPGGRLLVIDVLGDEDPLVDTHLQTLELLRDPSHVRNRSGSQWQDLLAQAGFRDVEAFQWPLRLEFSSWVERMRTPQARVAVIRELQCSAARDVQEALALEADGSFTVRTGSFWARRAP